MCSYFSGAANCVLSAKVCCPQVFGTQLVYWAKPNKAAGIGWRVNNLSIIAPSLPYYYCVKWVEQIFLFVRHFGFALGATPQ